MRLTTKYHGAHLKPLGKMVLGRHPEKITYRFSAAPKKVFTLFPREAKNEKLKFFTLMWGVSIKHFLEILNRVLKFSWVLQNGFPEGGPKTLSWGGAKNNFAPPYSRAHPPPPF